MECNSIQEIPYTAIFVLKNDHIWNINILYICNILKCHICIEKRPYLEYKFLYKGNILQCHIYNAK